MKLVLALVATAGAFSFGGKKAAPAAAARAPTAPGTVRAPGGN